MLAQTLPADEIVIVEDGPLTTELQRIIEKYKVDYPQIINIVKLPVNVGLGLALNEGLKVCRNELIARMDSDDVSLPTRCEKQVLMFMNDPELDIVGCPVMEFVGDISNIVGKRDVPLSNHEIHAYARRRDPFNHPAVMYKKDAVMRYGPYGNYRKNQDTDLWIKLLSNGCKGRNIDEYLLMFRFDENTYRKRKSWTNTKLLIGIRRNAYKIGFSSFSDYIIVAASQLGIYLMPTRFQKFIYQNFLRR